VLDREFIARLESKDFASFHVNRFAVIGFLRKWVHISCMAMQCVQPLNEVRESETVEAETNFIEPEPAIASPCWSAADCKSNLLVIRPSSVCLNLEELKCFEVVEHQFHHYGVTWKNAIALQPSNPAYPPRSGSIVLMGAPKSGWLEAIFSQPIYKFCCYVTSSQRTVVSAYDPQGKLLVRTSLLGPNLAGFESQLPPNAQVMIEEANISRITFYAFDGQLTLADLSFNFESGKAPA
jgi:hypothetical protein